jgi:NDP-sugar pyrophosphorylase family protein
MYGWKDNFYLLDIGTVEKYEQAQKEVTSGVFIQ